MEYIFTDVNEALPVLWQAAWDPHTTFERQSRNGAVREWRQPVTISYLYPNCHVLLSPERDANPFFHLFEAMWMLAGRNDVAWISQFLPRMTSFSDDGKTFHAPYGARWWRGDALRTVINTLAKDNDSRRAYLPIFDRELDVGYTGADMPCNVGVAFYIRDRQLDMTVFNRSNDLIWGALGANYVHFGFLQEFVACMLGVRTGTYSQISSCLHMYSEFDITKRMLATPPQSTDNYESWNLCSTPAIPLMQGAAATFAQWHGDLVNFIEVYTAKENYKNEKYFWFDPFFRDVVAPMYRAWRTRADYEQSLFHASAIAAVDWRVVAVRWLKRRKNERDAKAVPQRA